jgi:hypothetical protein
LLGNGTAFGLLRRILLHGISNTTAQIFRIVLPRRNDQ